MSSCADFSCTCSPKRFVRIRNFGFLANRRRATSLPLCFQLLPSTVSAADQPRLFSPRWCETTLAPSSMCWPHGGHRTTHSRRNPAPFGTSSSPRCRMRIRRHHECFGCLGTCSPSASSRATNLFFPLLTVIHGQQTCLSYDRCASHVICGPPAQIRPTSTPLSPSIQSP
jgi:hypothetical protein